MRGRTRATRRRCPFCDAAVGRPVWHEAGHAYASCITCGGVFADLEEEIYERDRRNAWDEAAPDADALGFYGDARAAAHTAFLSRIRPWGESRLLDVGCGLGFFLERARDAGWIVHGCEPSSNWAVLAAERLGTAAVTGGGVDAMVATGRKFDLITAWDVIEHVYDPVEFLAALRTLLAPQGRIFLRTPNLDYVLPVYRLRRFAGDAVELGPLNHVVYFTSRSMQRALCAAGFAPDRWLTLPPPQVATYASTPRERYAAARSATISLKNIWSRGADFVVRRTRGRLALGSDLDVLARAA